MEFHTRLGRRRAGVGARSAFTLIELLVAIAIIALMISILIPALNKAKNEGTKAACINNLREILKGSQMYFDDSGHHGLVPWYQMPVHEQFNNVNFVTPWVFGGFRAPAPDTTDGNWQNRDSNAYPAQIRPLNRFIDRTATADLLNLSVRGRDLIKSFICPGDRSAMTVSIAGDPVDLDPEQSVSSWQSNGSSFTLNTRFYQGYFGNNFNGPLNNADRRDAANARIAKHMVGGGAARFVFWMEQGMYASLHSAAPTHAQSQAGVPRFGWHRKFSTWSAGFADGHAQHGYFDTRIIYGMDGTIWQPNFAGPPDM